ncbi:EAL domain-containing protein [Vibrio lentus]|nr:EAL domain-containing protein [Vibrio lentus]
MKTLPIDELKIDKGFIRKHRCRPAVTPAWCRNIIIIGKNFGMVVLAEGVESSRHFSILKACGCDLIRGYYFSRPIPYEELALHLNQQMTEYAECSV